MRYRISTAVAIFVLLTFLSASGGSQDSGNSGHKKSDVVFVCACLKTKSCFCMTEAKMEGPCACGTEGGPPLMAVPRNSDWAKQNREALASK